MGVLAIDLGGTKLATAVFSPDGEIIMKNKLPLAKKESAEVGKMITTEVEKILQIQKATGEVINSIGISVPGICRQEDGTVWVPNIPGWDAYPLLEEVQSVAAGIPVTIDNDRACYILGESWKGNAKGCSDAIFLAVGTGIGAGILINGNILRGANDIAGAIGWMALEKPYNHNYKDCGCFESTASGEGIAKLTRSILQNTTDYTGMLIQTSAEEITAHNVFQAYDENDTIAREVVQHCIESWGMAIANLVSLFNPKKIILGGGVFGPAIKFIPAICIEAKKWAQPVGMQKVEIEATALGNHAGLYGAGFLALQKINKLDASHE